MPCAISPQSSKWKANCQRAPTSNSETFVRLNPEDFDPPCTLWRDPIVHPIQSCFVCIFFVSGVGGGKLPSDPWKSMVGEVSLLKRPLFVGTFVHFRGDKHKHAIPNSVEDFSHHFLSAMVVHDLLWKQQITTWNSTFYIIMTCHQVKLLITYKHLYPNLLALIRKCIWYNYN